MSTCARCSRASARIVGRPTLSSASLAWSALTMASAGATVVRIGVDSSLVDALAGTVAVLVVGATEAGLEDEPQAATQTVRATMAKVALA